ncbi:MAG: glycerate dehydrogenase [Verrucomicrobiales bacterium]|jgi:glycerate dehydrogenase
MKIVVLDGQTLNPGDLDWAPLQALGECVILDRTAPDAVAEALVGAAVAITNKAVLHESTLAQARDLQLIAVTATGYNVVDVAAASARRLPVCNVPAYSTPSVAQTVFAHILNITQRIDLHAREVAKGRWASAPDWTFWDTPLVELEGLTLGVIGCGTIGSAVARIGEAFGMKILKTRSHSSEDELRTLLNESDVISLHCPLTPKTEGLINRERLALMKPGAILINTSRGPLVDEQALAEALKSGHLAGVGLDVLSAEPPAVDHPLVGLERCFISPHLAWATKASRQRCLDVTVSNVAAFQSGTPVNVVNRS